MADQVPAGEFAREFAREFAAAVAPAARTILVAPMDLQVMVLGVMVLGVMKRGAVQVVELNIFDHLGFAMWCYRRLRSR